MTTDVDQPPLIMLCKIKDQWYKHSTVLNGLSYGMACFKVRFLYSKMTEPELRAYHPLQVFIID